MNRFLDYAVGGLNFVFFFFLACLVWQRSCWD